MTETYTDTDRFDFDEADVTETETNETQEDNMTEENTSTEPTQEEKDTQFQPLVDAFIAATEEALTEADASTGLIPDEALNKALEAYRAISGGVKYKNLGKNHLTEGVTNALAEQEYLKAVGYNQISQELAKVKATRQAAPKVQVDPREVVAKEYAALVAAAEAKAAYLDNQADYEGWREIEVDDIAEDVAAHLDWQDQDNEDRGEEPEVGEIGLKALKAIKASATRVRKSGGGTSVGGYSGPRRDVAAHIRAAFEGKSSGDFMTISEIVKADSEEYGDDHPSSGAVSARLFPGGDSDKCKLDFVTPAVSAENVKGAILV